MAGRLTDRFRRVLQDQRGFALVIALGVTVVLSMTVVTVIEVPLSRETLRAQVAATLSPKVTTDYRISVDALNGVSLSGQNLFGGGVRVDAVGLRRGHLIQLFTFEGIFYALPAAIVTSRSGSSSTSCFFSTA